MKHVAAFHIVQEVTLDASRERVWNALTDEVGKWWAFHTEEFPTTLELDARLGGHFVECWGEKGAGVLWGTVVYLRPPVRLSLSGSLGMKGSGYNQWSYELEEHLGLTKLTLEHHYMGHSEPGLKAMYEHGWKELLSNALVSFLASGKVYAQLSPDG